MDPGGWVVLGLLYLVLSALRKGGSKPRRDQPGRPRPPLTPKPPAKAGAGTRPGVTVRSRSTTLPPATGGDPTQREGARLQELLRQLGRTLDQATGPLGRAPDRRLPQAEDVEERRTLEVGPEAPTPEAGAEPAERPVVDLDEEAEAVVERRLREAEQRSAPLTATDHQAFDKRIRQEPADKTATRGYTAAELRNAVVWREILGPPVGLRED